MSESPEQNQNLKLNAIINRTESITAWSIVGLLAAVGLNQINYSLANASFYFITAAIVYPPNNLPRYFKFPSKLRGTPTPSAQERLVVRGIAGE